MAGVAYNPADPEQRELLAAIKAVESGNYWQGTGGADLSKAPRNRWGFPQWSGVGNSHAAGAYQFQPGTWEGVASQYNLNFANPGDQDAGAWYNAQRVYSARTGRSLDDDLNAGLWDKVRTGLQGEWQGILMNPGKFLSVLSDGVASEVSPGPTDTTGTPSFFTSPVQASASYFVRGGMILVGIAILALALYALLSPANVLPSAISAGS